MSPEEAASKILEFIYEMEEELPKGWFSDIEDGNLIFKKFNHELGRYDKVHIF